jgi:large subunit ribosomal protein L22
MTVLKFSPLGAAKVVAKVLASATANAEKNLHVKPESLYISEAFVNEGPTLKRFRPRAMGRAARIRKRTSHITVIVAEREEA